jgi:pimeloyl-ACP methyl ester carboxylesterase
MGDFAADLVEAGDGRPVVVFAKGFSDSAAHKALARRFQVFVADDAKASPRELGEAAAAWTLNRGFEAVGFVGAGDLAAAALWAASAAGERASAVVLISPELSLDDDAQDAGGLGALLTEVKTPKAVLIGTQDAGQPREAAALYRRRLSRSNVVLVFGAGADIAAERPDAFARAAGDFLDRQGRFAFMTESVALG